MLLLHAGTQHHKSMQSLKQVSALQDSAAWHQDLVHAVASLCNAQGASARNAYAQSVSRPGACLPINHIENHIAKERGNHLTTNSIKWTQCHISNSIVTVFDVVIL